ncbi:MAG: hypothetical protein ABIK28_25760 [Planctomycetota bacterium]
MDSETNKKVETILNELNDRYGLGEAFAAKVRPLVAKILDPSMPAEARGPLLNELAEVYESQARLRSNLELLHEFIHRAFHDQLTEEVQTQGDENRKDP